MTITVTAQARTFPTPQPEADGTLTWDSTTAVTVVVDDGRERGCGWTYSSSAAATLIDDQLAPVISDLDELNPRSAWTAMIRACRNIGATGLVMQAISAVDIALWDLHARRLDVALPDLWGRVRARCPIYGSGGFVTESSAQLRGQIEQWAEMGCSAMKIKIGEEWGAYLSRDLERVHILVDAAPAGTACMVDANGAYTYAQARRIGEQLDDLGITWFEEPVTSDDPKSLARLRDVLRTDVAAGEYAWTVDDMRATAESVDCLQLDVTRCGGYTGWWTGVAIAASRHLSVSAHCAPALHVPIALSTNNFRHLEYFVDHVRIEPELATGVPAVVDGALESGAGAGHGLRLRD